ncbi:MULTISPECIES: CHAP domain-containing protein [unclassified Lebetimonas]|uniref:CHAP domain-containing protein n=1 Tax=unclassified Lebetimonas TaxID=2648158 RepID=UPI0004666D58|nr:MULTISPECIES: CHAP domain-containing protein [unclassified Lebetimonas]
MLKFILFILFFTINFLFAGNDFWINFHSKLDNSLTKEEFLFKMEKFEPNYSDFINKLSNKYFDKPYKKLTPVQILDFQQKTKKEFVKYNHYGECVSSYMNVKEKANNYNMNDKYQCSELVNRFYRKVFHIKVIQRNGIATAKEYNNLTGSFNSKKIKVIYYQVSNINIKVKPRASFAFKNINDIKRKGDNYIYSKKFNRIFEEHPPVNGSILSFANNFHSKSNIYFGHTCIVKKVVKIKNGYTIYCFEQNVIRKKTHTISVNRHINFLKKNGHWIEIGSGILGPYIGRIGPVIGWSIPCYVDKTYIITKRNFLKLITQLINFRYLNLYKWQNKILKPFQNYHSFYVTKRFFNKIINNIIASEKIKNESFFEKLISWF